ncbi:MAG: hypothetical protein HQL17_05590 [Candidatus Omnitrophica bacterium]|nr:hypothetical protein [Candidatus Omnitrophota bacterium]
MSQTVMRPKYARRNVFIDKEFQTAFILKFCGLVAAGAVLMVIVLYYFSQQSTSVAFVNARVKVMMTSDFILPLLIQTVLVVMAAVGLGAVVVTLYVSHKIAGPLFRFTQIFKEIARGNLSDDVFLRKGDQLLGVAQDLNEMIVAVRAKVLDTKGGFTVLKADMARIGAFYAHNDPRRQEFLDLQLKVTALEKTLEYFKV